MRGWSQRKGGGAIGAKKGGFRDVSKFEEEEGFICSDGRANWNKTIFVAGGKREGIVAQQEKKGRRMPKWTLPKTAGRRGVGYRGEGGKWSPGKNIALWFSENGRAFCELIFAHLRKGGARGGKVGYLFEKRGFHASLGETSAILKGEGCHAG